MRTDSRQVTRPPGPRGVTARRAVLGARRDPLGFLVRIWHEYGDVVYFKAGPFHIYLLSDPDHIRDVLVTNNSKFMKGQGLQEMKRLLGEGLLTSEGEFHKRQRRLIQPMFHHKRIEGYGDVMVERSVRMRESWQDGQTLDVHQQMMRLTLSIVAKALFDTDIEDRDANRVAEALATSLGLFDRVTSPLFQLLMRMPASERSELRDSNSGITSAGSASATPRCGSDSTPA